jgi:Tfp pilus assembly protein FimV
MVAASAAVVVALGLLARVAEPAPAPAAVPVAVPAPVVVTVEPGETLWDVAARVAPGRPGAEVAAVAERIVADNALRSVRPEPGQVLRVAGG